MKPDGSWQKGSHGGGERRGEREQEGHVSWVSGEGECLERLQASKVKWGLMGNPIREGPGQGQEEAIGKYPGLPPAHAQPFRACIQLSSHVPTEVVEHLRVGSHLNRVP